MSSLQETLNEYLKLRRALGYKLLDPERYLRKFLAFLASEGAEWITIELARKWATSNPNVRPSNWAAQLRAVRLFANYRKMTDPRTEILPSKLLLHQPQRAKPYIYSHNEIAALVGTARQLASPMGLRGMTVSTLLGLLAATGLRSGEALKLDNSDIHIEQAMLHIRHGKFGKTRMVPIHPSTATALRAYTQLRDALHGTPVTSAFFVNIRGTRVSYDSVRNAFVRVSRQVGLRKPEDSHGPRLHDLRHTFVVRTITRWYQEGRDIERELPKLATYLGHVHWADTYWYITSVPELMNLASDRLEKALGETS
jgi:integrase